MNTCSIGPSKEIGLIKEFIKDAILEGKIPNQYEAAFELMLQKGNELGLNATTQ